MLEAIKTKKSKSVIALLKSAKTLFWKYGIRKVSVEEICQEAGVSKMTFYRSYSNKGEIAREVLRLVMEDSMNRYKAIMSQDLAFKTKMVEVIILKRENSQGISQEFIKDIYQSKDDGLRDLMEQLRQENRNQLLQDMGKAQDKGWVRKDLSLSFLLYILKDLERKVLDEELVAMYEKPEDLIMELTNFFFYGILP